MQDQNKFSIPLAIVVAGIIIAGGIYLSKMPSAPVVNNPAQSAKNYPIKAVNADDHIVGSTDAPIVVVEFSDLECPFCKSFHVTMQSIMSSYGKDGKVAWVYRQFPLSIHPKAQKEAEAAECAAELGGNTGFWKFIDQIFAITPSNNQLDASLLSKTAKDIGLDAVKFNACLDSGKYAQKVMDEEADGVKGGAQGTPYSVLVLKNPLSATALNSLNQYVASQGLGENVYVSTDKKQVVLNGAIPLQYVQPVFDAILK